MNTLLVIPARFASSRFPGKPLHMIKGHSLLARVWNIARAAQAECSAIERIVIATDDNRIAEHASSFGAEVVMTSPDCSNGTERVYAAVRALKVSPKLVINLQGDSVTLPPGMLKDLVQGMTSDATLGMGTLAVPLIGNVLEEILSAKAKGAGTGTLVVFDRNKNALYFSRSLIPNARDGGQAEYYKHIGIYAYRMPTLEHYLKLKPSPLECAEKLEQLRALENGIPIKVIVSDPGNRTIWSVDTPDDAIKAAQIIERDQG